MDGKFVSQLRSWDTMRKYFDIQRPGTVFIPINWAARLPDSEEVIKKAIEAEKKRIQLN